MILLKILLAFLFSLIGSLFVAFISISFLKIVNPIKYKGNSPQKTDKNLPSEIK